MSSVERLLGVGSSRRAGSVETPPADLRDGVVTRVDPNGDVWITPTDGDARHPLGPCKGARRDALVATPAGTSTTYALVRVPIPVRCEVLFACTSTGVWVIAYQERTA